MDRRTAIKRSTLILGSALSAGTLAGLVAGCTAEKPLDWKPQWFTEDEIRTLGVLADTILPRTDTPSATDVGVPQYIDNMVGNFWTEADQAGFRKGIEHTNGLSQNQANKIFNDLAEEDRIIILDQLVDEAKSQTGSQDVNLSRPFFLQLKELTYTGYFTSEIIGEQVLAYDPVPGEYIGDLPIGEVDKAWSL